MGRAIISPLYRVRHYEVLGLISSAPRQAVSRLYCDYGMAAIETIEKVRQAQRLGFSLKEIGPLLKAYGENPPSHDQEVAFLEARLVVIREKLETLRDVEDFFVGSWSAIAASERQLPAVPLAVLNERILLGDHPKRIGAPARNMMSGRPSQIF